jgi:hypothetical protein
MSVNLCLVRRRSESIDDLAIVAPSVSARACVRACVRVCACVCDCVCVCVIVCVCVCVCLFVCVCMLAGMYAYMFACCIHTYIHMHLSRLRDLLANETHYIGKRDLLHDLPRNMRVILSK